MNSSRDDDRDCRRASSWSCKRLRLQILQRYYSRDTLDMAHELSGRFALVCEKLSAGTL